MLDHDIKDPFLQQNPRRIAKLPRSSSSCPKEETVSKKEELEQCRPKVFDAFLE
jgi:hypothetical protein